MGLLSFQDVFHSNYWRFTSDLPNFELDGKLMFDTRVVMMTFTYSFGNQKLKSGRQHKTGSEEETQRTN